MTWVLTIIFLTPGEPPAYLQAGVLVSEEACTLAGIGIAQAVAEAKPGVRTGYLCSQTGVAA